MKLLSVVGARPQFIKLAALNCLMPEFKCQHTVVHTGQHYDHNMSKKFFVDFNINIDYDFGIGGISNCKQVAYMMAELENVLFKEQPSMVLVYGDTNSTLAGALAAKKCGLPLAHIEAGCRSYTNMQEEYNRVVTDHLSDLLFCHSKLSSENLATEGITKCVYVVGDVMEDMAWKYAQTPCNVLEKLKLKSNQYFLATVHRAENVTAEYIRNILSALGRLREKVVLVCHPRTAKYINGSYSNVTVIPPVSYVEMLNLEQNARLILTDSGGVQREACYFKKPCVILRNETEWKDILGGNCILSGNNADDITRIVCSVLLSSVENKRDEIIDGKSGLRIMEIINGSHNF